MQWKAAWDRMIWKAMIPKGKPIEGELNRNPPAFMWGRSQDERGLLKPARVDAFTSYRYYSADQLTRLNRILAMEDMGLSLEQIALLLEKEPTPDQIRGMLQLKQVELRQQLVEGMGCTPF